MTQAFDFMHDSLWDGKLFRALNVIDESNSETLASPASSRVRLQRPTASFTAGQWFGAPHCGINQWCEDKAIKLRHIQPGKLRQNAFIDQFNRTNPYKVLDVYLFEDLALVRQIADE